MQITTKYISKDNSTVSKIAYIMDHIMFGGLFGYALINVVLPLMVPITYFEKSILRLTVCLVLTGCFGVIISYSNNRTNRGTVTDIVSGMGLYTALTLGKYLPLFTKTFFWIMLLVTCTGLVIILCRRIKKQNRKTQIVLRRMGRSALLIRQNICIAGVIMLIVLPTTLYFRHDQKLTIEYNDKIEEYIQKEYSDDFYDANEVELPEVREVYGDEYRLAENIDTIKLIRDDETFQKLNYKEKCEVITAILRCEGRYLGLEEFDIEFEDLDTEICGYFNLETKCITINSKLIRDGSLPGGSADEILSTCLHECRHYYQYLMIELYAKATPEQRNLLAFAGEGVSSWMENMSNYHPGQGENDYYAYATQVIELDAKEYARTQIEEYHKLIDELLEEQNLNN